MTVRYTIYNVGSRYVLFTVALHCASTNFILPGGHCASLASPNLAPYGIWTGKGSCLMLT